MSAGLATKQRLHAAAHAAASSIPKVTEDEDYEFRHGRASDKIHFEPFELPRHPLLPNWNNVGTPGEVDRAYQARIFKAWDKWSRVGIAVILALLALSLYHSFVEPKAPQSLRGDDIYYRQRAERLATGKSIYVNDPHEGCLIGMHKASTGQFGVTVVSTHC